MIKNRIINGLKSSLVIAIFALFGIYATACSCNEMDSDKVYNNFVDFVNASDNIFKFEEETINNTKVKFLKIDIPYDDAVNEKLNYEANGYHPQDMITHTNDGDKITRYVNADIVGYNEYLLNLTADANFSDFYVLKAIYEPMLEVATYQIGQNYQILKNNVSTLSKEKASEVNDKLKVVQEMSTAVINSVTILNNNKSAFTGSPLVDGEPVVEDNVTTYYAKSYIFKYRNREDHIYFELKNIKKSFENLIMACFDLNKSFTELYLSIRASCDFSTVSEELFTNEETNITYKIILSDYLNYMLTMASQVAYMIDGGQCSFINSTESFATLYANIVETVDGKSVIKNFANRYIYQEHLLQMHDAYMNKILFNFTDDYRDMLKASYLPYVCNCQFKFNAFMQQYENFVNSISGINYKDYIMSDIYKDNSKTYMDYAMTLNGEERTKFIAVQEFLVNYYVPLAKALQDFQTEILK